MSFANWLLLSMIMERGINMLPDPLKETTSRLRYATPHQFLFPHLFETKAFRDFERSWTRNDDNRDLLRGLGESTCADFVKVSLCNSINIRGNSISASISIVS